VNSFGHFYPGFLTRKLDKTGLRWKSALSAAQVVQIAASLSFSISLSVMLGWLFNWPMLTSWVAISHGMLPETAFGVLLASVGLWCTQKFQGPHVPLIGGFLALLALLNIVAHSHPPVILRVALLSTPPFQMTQESAIALLMLGLGLLLLSWVPRSLPALWAIALLGNSVVIVGLVTVLAYLSGLSLAPWWGGFFLQMSLPAAVSYCALGTTLISIFFQEAKGTSHQFSITAAVMAILGLLLLFAGVDAAVLTGSNSVLNARAIARRASDQVRALQALTESIRKAESGQRGYLLTGDPRYLDDFWQGHREFEQAAREQNVENAKLVGIIQRKFDELTQTIEMEQSERHPQAIALVKSAEGLRLMQQIDVEQKVVTALWQKQLALRRDESQQSILSIRQTVLRSYGMAVLFALGALLLIVAEIKRRSRIEADLRDKEVKIYTELREQRVRAEEANRAKSSFLASMSHEIRTPMNAILGMADMLWETELTPTQRHYVEIFRRAGGTLLTLINDILNLSKIESGNFSLEHVDFDLAEVAVDGDFDPKGRSQGHRAKCAHRRRFFYQCVGRSGAFATGLAEFTRQCAQVYREGKRRVAHLLAIHRHPHNL
jgi:signal transduction histidine kinase